MVICLKFQRVPHFNSFKNQQGKLSFSALLLLFNKHFLRCRSATHAREHSKLRANISSRHGYIVNLSMSVIAPRAYALCKCKTMPKVSPAALGLRYMEKISPALKGLPLS